MFLIYFVYQLQVLNGPCFCFLLYPPVLITEVHRVPRDSAQLLAIAAKHLRVEHMFTAAAVAK